jgi:hypothetical protein
MIRILLSDDNAPFRQTSKEQGAAVGVEIVAFDDWESSQAALDENFESFDGVIIDGKGKLRDSSKGEDGKHLSTAINWLKEQLGKKGYIPVIIYTGFHAELEPFTSTDTQILGVFDKSKNTFIEVLEFLKTRIANSPIEKLRHKHSVVFSFSKRFFSEENQQIILTIFQNCTSGNRDFIWKKNILDGLRRLNEALIDTIPLHYYQAPYELRDYLAKIMRENPPRKLVANMGNRTITIVDFFSIEFKAKTQDNFPSPIANVVKNIYYTAASFASHTREDQSEYFPSEEMILGLVYSHFGCYHWFNSIIKE